jgi:hypothetical protein
MATMVESIKKAITGTQPLEVYERELQQLTAEIARLDGVLANGDSEVDELEAAITRKNALQIRMIAVRNKLGAENARMKESKRAALQAEGEAMRDAVEKAKAGLVAPMVALFSQIGQIHAGTRAYDAVLAQAWKANYPYQATPVSHLPLTGLRIALAQELVKLAPERFSMTAQGLVDKKGEAK